MAEINLSKYGISGATEIVHNPSYDLLFEEETKPELEGYEKGQEEHLYNPLTIHLLQEATRRGDYSIFKQHCADYKLCCIAYGYGTA